MIKFSTKEPTETHNESLKLFGLAEEVTGAGRVHRSYGMSVKGGAAMNGSKGYLEELLKLNNWRENNHDLLENKVCRGH